MENSETSPPCSRALGRKSGFVPGSACRCRFVDSSHVRQARRASQLAQQTRRWSRERACERGSGGYDDGQTSGERFAEVDVPCQENVDAKCSAYHIATHSFTCSMRLVLACRPTARLAAIPRLGLLAPSPLVDHENSLDGKVTWFASLHS
jgi:hypothetical protein